MGVPHQVPDAARGCYGYRVRHGYIQSHVPLLAYLGSYREEIPGTSYYKMHQQGIMVVVFIKTNIQSKMMNTTTMIHCRHISL